MGLNDIPIGYGILFHGNSWISRKIQEITNSYWNHVAISLGDGELREACWKGVRRNSIEKYLEDSNELQVFSIKGANKYRHIKIALRSGDYSNLDYGFIQLALIFLVWRFGKRHWWIRGLLQIWNRLTNRFICSELYGRAARDEGYILVQKSLAEVIPGDYDPSWNNKLKAETGIIGSTERNKKSNHPYDASSADYYGFLG